MTRPLLLVLVLMGGCATYPHFEMLPIFGEPPTPAQIQAMDAIGKRP